VLPPNDKGQSENYSARPERDVDWVPKLQSYPTVPPGKPCGLADTSESRQSRRNRDAGAPPLTTYVTKGRGGETPAAREEPLNQEKPRLNSLGRKSPLSTEKGRRRLTGARSGLISASGDRSGRGGSGENPDAGRVTKSPALRTGLCRATAD